ncbi:winged helix-turn-helix transcriptional regulator [Nocardia otitidiscaviarum]|uniref:winged helix-turn-helix transcriptional regulator n=1 Tax=Nocardia otitidiscaviarum TaxID=1823 RepID=UPI001894D712|nr:helix-turn-helix domain-containing protein [Nocardia otitidiscaviarum]MBF6180917.1 helix-turn-helix transcriptional regulator [Nocardia otitidiscaviarum]
MSVDEEHCGEFVADCRLRAATDLFAHAWDPVLLAALRDGPRRRGELRTRIGGLSDKAMTEALRRLLGCGLIERRSYARTPPRVDYGLTSLGVSFVDGPMRALAAWVDEFGAELPDADAGARPLRAYGW